MYDYSRIFGGSMGLLSSYAIEILMLYILNCHDMPKTPVEAVELLIETFEDFDFENNVITH